MSKIKIVWCCFINQSGYGISAQNYIKALDKSGKYDIKLEIYGGKPSRPAVSDSSYEYFMKMKNKEHSKKAIQIYQVIPTLQRRMERLDRNLGFCTYETYSPPEEWVNLLNKNDAILSPSKFNYKIFAHARIKKPIFHIPHCIDMEEYHNEVKPLKRFDKFTFLYMGTWKKRKNYEALVESWFKEFTEDDNVQLLIKTDKPVRAESYVEKVKKELKNSKGFAPILFENKIYSEKELPGFMKSFDCFILPTTGEGFNIPGLQSMALGVPVIITNYSGCQDYAAEENATLLSPEGFIFHKDMDGIPQFKNRKWAFVSVKQIREKMRYVLNNPEKVKDKVDKAYIFSRSNFNYNKIETLFTGMIDQLYGI